MKIAVNLLYLVYNTHSGIGKHIEDILTGFEKLNVLDEFYLIVRDRFYTTYFDPTNTKRPFEKVKVLTCHENRLFKAFVRKLKKGESLFRGMHLNSVIMPKHLKDIDFDLMFYPFNESVNNVSIALPLVAVVHDLFYKNFSNPKKKILSKLHTFYVDIKHRQMLEKAEKIVAISEFVKSDILKHFPGVKSGKIVVIPNAVVASEETAVPEGIRTPFLLCVSEQCIHKNHITLLKAYHLIKNKIPHHLVLLGGAREETPRIVRYIHENALEDKISLISDIPDAERNWLYKNTDLLISPSLHEGFGRTPVEAAMLGAMVLTSRETSLPEVTRDMLNYYEPATDEQALADKILELLDHPTPPEKRAQIASTYQALYDPVRIAGLYYELFCNTVQNRKK